MKTLALAFAIFGFVTNVSTSVDPAQSIPQILTGTVYVTDGDSFRMGEKRVRLFGIDAVEARQTCTLDDEDWACGRASRRALERMTNGQTVRCEVRDMDRTRYVSVCHVGDVDINAQMVRRGWAVAYAQYSLDYVAAEAAARADSLALWRSEFERPHEYRARLRRQQAAAQTPQEAPSADCNIKGNISRSGTRIFHMPGQADYQRTRISESTGERWFCSTADAERSGWRRAMR